MTNERLIDIAKRLQDEGPIDRGNGLYAPRRLYETDAPCISPYHAIKHITTLPKGANSKVFNIWAQTRISPLIVEEATEFVEATHCILGAEDLHEAYVALVVLEGSIVLEDAQRWRKVEEEEPPKDENVIFLTINGDNEHTLQTVKYAGYMRDDGNPVYIDTHEFSPVCAFTHWMPSPAPPKEVE